MPGPSVATVMHRGVVTCRPETPLPKVAQMMAGHRIHSVVIDADGVWGVVSDLDVACAFAAGCPDAPAAAVGSTPAVTVDHAETLHHGAELMAEHGVTHLVVVKRGEPVGVLSTLDVARVLADAR